MSLHKWLVFNNAAMGQYEEHGCFLQVGNQSTWRKPTPTQRKHANSTQKGSTWCRIWTMDLLTSFKNSRSETVKIKKNTVKISLNNDKQNFFTFLSWKNIYINLNIYKYISIRQKTSVHKLWPLLATRTLCHLTLPQQSFVDTFDGTDLFFLWTRPGVSW